MPPTGGGVAWGEGRRQRGKKRVALEGGGAIVRVKNLQIYGSKGGVQYGRYDST